MRRGARGPWSAVVDDPAPGQEPLGPPPGFLALVGIGSCTIVTVAGVASRGSSGLAGMRVAFEVGEGLGGTAVISQQTTITANADGRDRLRLTRAVPNCPVGRDFTQRGVDIDDVVLIGGTPVSDATAAIPAADVKAPLPRVFAPGRVEVVYLPETAEWLEADGRRILDQEGEVIARVACDTAGGRRHWGYLGGHSGAGWAPRPSGYALASLAASSLMTLRRSAEPLGINPATLSVAVAVTSDVPAGGKEASQEAAARGTFARVRWTRTVNASPVGRVAPADSAASIAAALKQDPIYAICTRGDLLTDSQISFEPSPIGVPG
jgi:uncharacterized OsmC-like protein